MKLRVFKSPRWVGLRRLKLWNATIKARNGLLIFRSTYPYHNRIDLIDNLIQIRDGLNSADLESLREHHREETDLNP